MTQPNFDITKNLFLSCDWGTTSFRLKLANLKTGDVLENVTTDYGIKKAHGQWLQKKDEIGRRDFFLSYLKENITHLENNMENIPVIISGMASSNLGLKKLPYASLPIDLNPSQLNIHIREADDDFPNPLMLISGIKAENDVIRGEETQIFGMVDKLKDSEEAIIILPGTHSKHVIIRNKQIVDFKTYITGELFELLSNHSILKNSLASGNEDMNMNAFRNGIQESMEGNILNSLFKIRAGDILHKTDKAKNAAFLSGLLIGQEAQALRDLKIKQVFLAGEGRLKTLYSNALIATLLSDEESEHLTVRGHQYILNHYRKGKL